MSLPEHILDGYTSVGEGTKIGSGVTIGRYCSIARLCTIGAEQHDYTRFATWAFSQESKTSIGHDVWIGCNAVIMTGVNIGIGAVIGAGSVVTHDVPPYAIAFGVPATVQKNRFPDHVIEALLKSRWWELPPDIVGALPSDPLAMIAELTGVISK